MGIGDSVRAAVTTTYRRAGFVPALFICLVILAAFSGLAMAAETAPDEVLTLDEAIGIALKNQPAIEAQYGQALAAEAKAGQARGGYYPKLSVGTAYTRIWPVSPQTSQNTSLAGLPPGSNIPTSTTGEATTYEQYAATGSLSQLLFDFGKTPAQVASANLTAQAARLDLQNIREQVIFNVKQAYYGLLASQASRNVAQETIGQLRKHLEYARALFSVGSKSKFEVTKAEVDLSSGQTALIKAENGVRLAKATLNDAIGMPDRGPYTVQDSVPSGQWIEQPFDESVRAAFDRRPDLLSVQKQRQAAQESIKAAKRDHYPTFNGVAAGTYVGTEFPLDHGWTAGVNMVLPLFTGFITSQKVAEAKANLLVASGNERNLKQRIILELERAYIALREASERMKGSEIAVKQGRENLELANERYAAGLAIGVEVADAIVAYARTQLEGISARYDYRIAQAQIDKAIGGVEAGATGKGNAPHLTSSGK